MQPKTQKFTKAEIVIITENFKNEIGRGGFGSVFSGSLKNGTRVAVKKLTQSESSKQGPKEFRTEVTILNLYNTLIYMKFNNCIRYFYESAWLHITNFDLLVGEVGYPPP